MLKREQPLFNPDRFVFIDETWAKTNMTWPRGRAPRGERLLASVPHGHWKTRTFLTAFRTTGLTATLVVDGAISGQIFLSWVRHHRVPTLQPGDVVVTDNLSVNQVAGIREAITTAGEKVIYLPPTARISTQSTVSSRSSSGSRRGCPRGQSRPCVSVCGDTLDHFTEAECRSYFQRCGYRYTEMECALLHHGDPAR